jgi:hypothetical protein
MMGGSPVFAFLSKRHVSFQDRLDAAVVFSYEQTGFPCKENVFSHKEIGFPCKKRAFPCKERAFPHKEIRFACKETGIPCKETGVACKEIGFAYKKRRIPCKEIPFACKETRFACEESGFAYKEKTRDDKESGQFWPNRPKNVGLSCLQTIRAGRVTPCAPPFAHVAKSARAERLALPSSPWMLHRFCDFSGNKCSMLNQNNY